MSSPLPAHCITHLKLLESFYLLRCKIANHDDLFDISNSTVDQFPDQKVQALAKLCEKRWQVYLVRAEDRFRTWYESVLPRQSMITQKKIISDPSEFSNMLPRNPVRLTADTLPPIDILMIWHAYMLNPRNYLDDCLRNGMKSVWSAGIRWDLIDNCISTEDDDFIYKPSAASQSYFQSLTHLQWDNLDDSATKTLSCPKCNTKMQIPWTDNDLGNDLSKPFQHSTGYADSQFETTCPACNLLINHETLRVQKFRKDMLLLIKHDIPMSGTLLNYNGKPITYPYGYTFYHTFLPNKLIISKMSSFLELTDPAITTTASISSVSKLFEKCLSDRKVLKTLTSNTDLLSCRTLVRQMLLSYWGNSSPFSLDLVGAVIRQGVFIEKMHTIDWLHSPTVHSTMDRLLVKYERFIQLIQKYSSTTVPTLDIDLAWHTHQLSPPSYYQYCDKITQSYINHDDKIEECTLSDAFERTSKRYQRIYNEKYSTCMCWYCEAVREGHRTMFSSKSICTSNHLNESDKCHISAHNSVRIIPSESVEKAYNKRKKAKLEQLKKSYQSAVKRTGSRTLNTTASDRYAYYWGYPIPMPNGYAPYMEAPGLGGEYIYPTNPFCMASDVGQNGNCVGCGGGCFGTGCGGGGCGGD